jgi:hypothetical protein
MDTPYFSTREVLPQIGCTLAQLEGALKHGRFSPPEKGIDGRYRWRQAEIDAAREALSKDNRRKEYRALRGEVTCG